MSTSSLLLTFVAVGLLTFAMRFSFIGLAGRVHMPGWLSKSLEFVPPAVLSALIWPELVLHNGALDVSFGNQRLLAGLIALFTAWVSRSVFITLGVGIAALWLLQTVFP